MRISNWSSDVCSSDLSAITVLIDGQNHSGLNAPAARNIFPGSFALDRDEAALPHRFDLASHRKSVLAGRGPGRVGEGLRGKAVFTIRSACRAIHWDYHHFSENVQSEARRPDALLQIGRASCGERVCRYV